jgi:pimeloyl-ACP methyl ester carboxylesterase
VLIHSTSDAATDDGHSVLFIHGQSGSSLIWMRVLPRLRDYGLRTFAVLHRDESQLDAEAVDQFANAAALGRLLDEEHRSPAVIVGHGAGAGLALALAATAPRHVRALVLVAPATGPQTIGVADRVLATPLLGASLAWLGFRGAGLALRIGPLRQLILTKVIGPNPGDTGQIARQLADGRTWRNFATKHRRLVSYARCLQHGLSQLSCPVFIVAGTHDPIAAPRVVDALARRLPGARTVTTETGHLVPIDDPDAVADTILGALRIDYRNPRASVVPDPVG